MRLSSLPGRRSAASDASPYDCSLFSLPPPPGAARQIERVSEGEFRERSVMPVRYIPLCDAGEQVPGRG